MKIWDLILRRALAYSVDVMILFVVLAPTALLVERATGIRPSTPGQVWVAAVLSFSIPVWTYFTLSDVSKRGTSLGKKFLGVSVKSTHGPDRISLKRGLIRTAVKLLPWEIAHIFGFALVSVISEELRLIGLISANILVIAYLVIFILQSGRRSLHDFLVNTEVVRLMQTSDDPNTGAP